MTGDGPVTRPELPGSWQRVTVIPVELQQRTWTYLTAESGATTVARRDPAGHYLTPAAVDALRVWLENVTDHPA
jgi:predicted esterase